MDTWLEWARGPIFRAAFVFMILGLIRHAVLTALEIRRAVRRAGDKNIPWSALVKTTVNWLFPIHKARDRALYSATTVPFHVAVIVTPIFLAGHIALWKSGTGLAWPAIPNALADILTIVVIVTAIALVIERAASRDTRSLSRFSDYAIPLLIAVPFASGFLVMHPAINPFAFEATMFVHVMSANLIFVLIPVTKLSHCVLLPTTQVIAEVAWHFPPHAGSEAGAVLGKENEPV